MKKITIGDNLPNISVATTADEQFPLKQLKGKNVVLYFYPKDNTPGCTTESKAFRDHYKKFQSLQTEIIGISRDSLKSHEKFKCKHEFPFELISDAEGELCELFDVIRPKNMFGKIFQGIQRSTFIFDKNGKLRVEFRGVKVKDHIDEVLTAIKKLN